MTDKRLTKDRIEAAMVSVAERFGFSTHKRDDGDVYVILNRAGRIVSVESLDSIRATVQALLRLIDKGETDDIKPKEKN